MNPETLKKHVPLTTPAQQLIASGRHNVQHIITGTSPLFLIMTGPCSIHDPEEALEYATRLKELQDRVGSKILLVMRAYFEKPRTVGGWTGFAYDPDRSLNGGSDIARGVSLSRRLLRDIADIGVLTTSELLEPNIAPYLADLLTCASIGARTVESQPHRHLASALNLPVGFKNSIQTGNAIQAIDAVRCASGSHARFAFNGAGEMVTQHTPGNHNCFVILRGSNQGPNYDAETVTEVSQRLIEHGQPSRVIVDCSHGNSGKDHTKQGGIFRTVTQHRLAGLPIAGCMLESNICEGAQPLGPNLKKGVSITDACINWKETEELILEAYEALKI